MSTPAPRYDREEREIEFARALAFSDGVFAIAITLLVLTIDVPSLSGADVERRLVDGLWDLAPSIGTYFLSFAVIGLLWLNHHRLFARVRRLDVTAMWLNLLALSFTALMPFSTEVMGRFGDEPAAVTLYALNLAVAVASYTLLWWYLARRDMLGETLTPTQIRWELGLRLWIVGGFLLSIPAAFLSTALAGAIWFVTSTSQNWIAARLRAGGRLPPDSA